MTEVELPIFNNKFFEELKKLKKVPPHFRFLTEEYSKNEAAKIYLNLCKQYINAAEKVGLFQSVESNDIKRRLESRDNKQFFPALSHCKASFFFSDMCGFNVKPTPPSRRDDRNLDLKIIYNDIEYFVEVKTPIKSIDWDSISAKNGIRTLSWVGDDSDELQEGIRRACRQFDNTKPNILFLDTSYLRAPIDKYLCLKAFIGQQAVTFIRNEETGEMIEQDSVFLANGISVNPKNSKGRYIKKDRSIPFSRISMIVCFQDHIYNLIEYNIKKDVFVIHNPYAKNPVPQKMFNRYPQLIKTSDNIESFKMEWI